MIKPVKYILIVTAIILTVIIILLLSFFFTQPKSIKKEDFTIKLTVEEDGTNQYLCATLSNKSMHYLRIIRGAQLITVYFVKNGDDYENKEAESIEIEDKLCFSAKTMQKIDVIENGEYKAKAIVAFKYRTQEIEIESNEIYFEIK